MAMFAPLRHVQYGIDWVVKPHGSRNGSLWFLACSFWLPMVSMDGVEELWLSGPYQVGEFRAPWDGQAG